MQKIILAFFAGAALTWAATGVADRDRAIQSQKAIAEAENANRATAAQLQACQTRQDAFKDGLVYGRGK